ncbi:28S ribosomal protein S31, mitochondrial isoform X2 [Scyliorhinus canicula]|uniref:28S ribosomal protein S31, mitochondrial isoform X2 n=1 Tax=Scyliorhinus canicula TaxID=7830 RepID=UPI0018F42C3E|nr:28S ribosomal protein S31, mitochondrial isoform X2 [Scyliorhinus canicula]
MIGNVLTKSKQREMPIPRPPLLSTAEPCSEAELNVRQDNAEPERQAEGELLPGLGGKLFRLGPVGRRRCHQPQSGCVRPGLSAPRSGTMQRALVAVLLKGRVTGPCRPEKVCRLTKKGQRHIFTGSAVLCKEDESKHFAPPEQQKDSEEKKAAASGKNDLLNLIGGMKVEVSTKKKFKAMRTQRLKDQSKVQPENIESASSMFQKATEDIKSQCKEILNPDLVAAASAVASSMPYNKRQIESELLKQLRKHELETEAQKNGDASSIGDIIADMKVGKRPGARAGSRSANQIRFDEDGQGYVRDRGATSEFNAMRKRKGLFIGKKLNIFPVRTGESDDVPETVSLPSLWDIELANHIAAVTEQLPRNGFEQMIRWTKEGKLRQFPVNNEAGLEVEEGVEFHEHIFIEKHLNGFPEQGPIRHFMELVVNGLSKNPYLTVQQKIEHIDWFRQYFHEKEDILKENEVYIS